MNISNSTFQYGRYNVQDLSWLVDALSNLKTNRWDETTPVYFDGAAWGDSVREQAAISLLDALKSNTNAKSLVLRNASLGLKAQKAVEDVFERNTTLQSVSLKNLRADDTSLPATVPLALFRNRNLRSLSLANCVLDKPSCVQLGKLVRKSKVLHSLSLCKVTFPSGGWAYLTNALIAARSLRKLDLQNCASTDAEKSKILNAIGQNLCLTILNLDQTKLGSKHGDDIARMIQANTSLIELSLRKNDLTADAVRAIFEVGIVNNTTLESLGLQHNPVGDEGADYIVAGLKKNGTLKTLNLMECEIWHGGCSAIARGISSFEGIQHLTLDGNEIEDCAQEILTSLEKNLYIHKIGLNLPRLMRERDDSDSWKRVDLYLKMNKAKRRFIAEDRLAPSLLPEILGCSDGAASQPDVLFQLLREIPDVLDGAIPAASKEHDSSSI